MPTCLVNMPGKTIMVPSSLGSSTKRGGAPSFEMSGAPEVFGPIRNVSAQMSSPFNTAVNTLNVNAGNAAVNVAGNANDTVNVGGLTVSGIYNLNGGGDTIVATNGANIAGVNTGLATTAEALSLTGDITMTEAQHDGFGVISGSGTNVVTLTTSNVNDAVTGNGSIESYVLNDVYTFINPTNPAELIVAVTVVPFANAFSFFIGAVIAEIWMRVAKKSAESYLIAIASGAVAGESLASAGVAMWQAGTGLLARE